MQFLLDLSWVIPSSPIVGSIFIALLLVSFNRTMNRLTKPVSFILITSILISTIFSFLLYINHLSGEIIFFDFLLFKIHLISKLLVDNASNLALTLLGLIALIVMIGSYYKLPRAKGYVRYLTFLAMLFGISFFTLLSNVTVHDFIYPYFQPLSL